MAEKQRVEDLAIFGGTTTFDQPRHVGQPNIPNRENLLARINDLLDRRWLTNDGPFVREFEDRLCDQLGVEHCVAMSSGTVALEIAYRALELSGEVIVPSFTFVATAHALQWQQITPVFCDIDPHTHTLDPESVRRAISPKTTGIVGVHTRGRPCAIDEITAIGREHHLKIVFDASHAFGCTYRGIPIGCFGDAEIFSFHATKFINTFEGGAVATKSAELAERMRFMRNFGFSGYDDVTHVGTNGKLTEVAAAMGLGCLDSLTEFMATNEENWSTYESRLSRLKGLRLLPRRVDDRDNLQYVVAEVDPNTAALTRNELLQVMWAENIRCRRYFYPGCHRMEPYRSLFPIDSSSLPVTQEIADRVIQFPTGTAVTPANVVQICSLTEFCLNQGADIKRRLASMESA